MILSRDHNSLGYINRVLYKIQPDFSPLDFLNYIEKIIDLDFKNGLNVSCFEIPVNFEFPDFSTIEEHDQEAKKIWEISQRIKSRNNRIVFFMPAFYFLGSQLPDSLKLTKKILNSLSIFLESIGISGPSIIIRIGSAYGARKITMQRFSDEINALPIVIRERLAVCNDEKPSLFSVTDLMSGVYYKTKIPILFRFLPHHFNTGGLTIREALFLGCSTWPSGIKPIFMYSESSELDDSGKAISQIPSEYLTRRIPTFGLELDIILDSPIYEKSCMRYMRESQSLKPIVINKNSK